MPIHAAPPYGLIRFRVPAGRHTLELRFASTPVRTASTALSIAALCVAVALLFVWRRRPAPTQPLRSAPGTSILAIAIGVALLALRLGAIDPLDLWPRLQRFDGQTVRGLQHPTSVAFSGGEQLLGYELRTQPAAAGQPLDVDLYWATETGTSFRAVVRLADQQGDAWTGWDKIVHYTGLIGPPSPPLWGRDRYTSLRYHVEIPLGTPPGTYDLIVSVLDPASRTPRFVTAGTALNAERTEAVVGQVLVDAQPFARSTAPGSVASQGVPLTSDGFVLLDCEMTMDSAFVGEAVVLYPTWGAEAAPSASTFALRLVDAAGEVALAEQRPLSPRYPPAHWQPGSVVRDRAEVLLPAHLAAGVYTWHIEVDGRGARVGALDVRVPVREQHIPPNIESVGEVLDRFAELVGYSVTQRAAGDPLRVTLYWRARQQTAANYKVFLHLLDAEGRVAAQSDAVPAAWARPTTSWLPPEAIEDVHVLHVPAGLVPGNHLIVGLYERETGRRATTSSGADHISLKVAPLR